MQDVPRPIRSRRRLLKAAAALPAALWLPRSLAEVPPTPACEPGSVTMRMFAGPFYAPASPEKADFRADDPEGEPVDLLAEVLDTRCQPVGGAVVDLWHADSRGRYDNDGFRLRGRQQVDGSGAVRFSTIRPARYGWRTPHYHVRIFDREGRRLLTTQLYFPGEPANEKDSLFRPELVMQMEPSGAVAEARFAFVVKAT